jgi:hypothetical protein
MTQTRRFSRVHFDAQSFMEFAGFRRKAHLLDISLKGALIAAEGHPPVNLGDQCKLSVHLGSSDVVLKFEAEVAHVEEDSIGVKFVKVDLQTMIHLRRLMECNTSDSDGISRELAFLVERP